MLIHVGIPVIDGKPHFALTDSLLAESLLGAKEGFAFYVDWVPWCSLIGHARNRLAARFLMMGTSDVFISLDADMSWQGGELLRLAKRPEPVVGATYRTKTDDEKYNVRGPIEERGDDYSVAGLPGGFLKIDRSAFDALDVPQYDGRGVPLQDFFPTGVIDDEYFGEDYGFCHLWKQSGGDVILDPSLIVRHHDGPRTFTGNPRMWLQEHIDASNRRLKGETLSYVADMIRWRSETDGTIREAVELVNNPIHGAPQGVLRKLIGLARNSDGPILEMGSGLSTVLMAAATKQQVFCLEESRDFADHLRGMVGASGVRNVAMVRAPLKDGWYGLDDDDRKALPKRFGLAFVDGPERLDDRMAFFDEFGEACDVIVCDDANNRKYRTAVSEWAESHGRSVEMFDRTAILTRD